jgi:hypothetical protein
MAETLISDIIIPSVFLPYVVERTAETSAFIQSGIVDADPTYTTLANGPGTVIDMPFWQDLSGEDEVISDTGSLSTDKIVAQDDKAIILNRGKGWSTNDLAQYISGDDPMGKIGDLVGDYWARRLNHGVIAMLAGVFASALMAASNTKDIYLATGATVTDKNTLNGKTFLDAKQVMGDASGKLTGIAMHSLTETDLLKRDLITFRPDSEGKLTLKQFQQLNVVVDDSLPVETINALLVFTTYLFGQGAIAFGVSTNDKKIVGGFGTWRLEYARAAGAGQDLMYNRRRMILHPRGIKWLGANMAGSSPSNTEMTDGNNWQRVYEAKNVRIVRVRHNVSV